MIKAFIALPLEVLERLGGAVDSGRLAVPVTEVGLLAGRLEALRSHLPLLGRFSDRASLSSFVAAVVLQRRREHARPRPTLVWTGPTPLRGRARRTSVVLPELFEKARREVFIAGYSFKGGRELLAPLHAVMRDHGVDVRIVIDGSDHEVERETSAEEILHRVVKDFWGWTWSHRDLRPTLLYDPDTLKREWSDRPHRWKSIASMHAKCVVIDRTEVLIGSANFTARARDSNIEVGVVIEDPEFAEELLHQWQAVIGEGSIRGVDEESP